MYTSLRDMARFAGELGSGPSAVATDPGQRFPVERDERPR